MNRYPLHLYLVSDQPTPNLTPALDPTICPERAFLAITPESCLKGRYLQKVLSNHGIQCEQLDLPNAYDLNGLRLCFEELLQRVDAPIAVNITGGSKPMSIAAFEVFTRHDQGVFYVSPADDAIDWLHPRGQPRHPIADRVRLKDFLGAHGVELCGQHRRLPAIEELQAWETLVARTRNMERRNGVGTFNRIMTGVDAQYVTAPVSVKDQNAIQPWIEVFSTLGLLAKEGSRFIVAGKDAHRRVTGGWFEEHLHARLELLRSTIPGCQDIARSVEVRRHAADGGHIPNELDVALLADNRLWVFECKTRVARSRANQEGEATSHSIYKLEALLRPFGGQLARGVIVSLFGIPGHDERRLRGNSQLDLICGPEVQRLDAELLRLWGT